MQAGAAGGQFMLLQLGLLVMGCRQGSGLLCQMEICGLWVLLLRVLMTLRATLAVCCQQGTQMQHLLQKPGSWSANLSLLLWRCACGQQGKLLQQRTVAWIGSQAACTPH
jgi:hypothetical protein